jgi:hypothetical protein
LSPLLPELQSAYNIGPFNRLIKGKSFKYPADNAGGKTITRTHGIHDFIITYPADIVPPEED